jgi:predicted DNA-binding transcriptional regulator YafY
MKIDRLLGIINILTQKDMATAPELAERFEVSRRTINRDIEDICKAGIPIVTRRGTGGGIYIQQGYKLDKSLLKSGELEQILTGLKGLSSIIRSKDIQALLNKLAPASEKGLQLDDIITIDLASHYKASLSDKIERIKEAVSNGRVIKFTYYNKAGRYGREIEPYIITFKWADWYVFGYCLYKNDFRMFKLNRLWDLEVTKKTFEKREIPRESLDFDAHLTDENPFEAVFDKSVEYLLVESYGPNSYSETDDGKLLLHGCYTNIGYIVSWILGFGEKARVISPPELADEIKRRAENILDKYK